MAEESCKICNKSVSRRNPGIKCDSFCRKYYHGKCVDITGTRLDSLRVDGISWTCADCRGRSGRSTDELQISSARPDVESPGESSSDTLQEIRAELKQIREQQTMLLRSVQFCCDKISDFEMEMNRLNDYIKKTDQISIENDRLKVELNILQSKVNDIEQVARLNNVEIQGIPEREGENLYKIVEKIGEYIKHDISPSSIDCAHRVQTNRTSTDKKIKNIVVRFTSRGERDRFLLAAKNMRMVDKNSRKLSLEGVSDDFYVNEHLTLTNKILYKNARMAAKSKDYKYVWVKNGMIFCRKTDSSRILVIKNSDSIGKM